jgi:pyridoxal phosphate enzyme (YggS family)
MPLTIADRLNNVRQRMKAAADRAGRSSRDVTLVVVGKTQPVPALAEAVAAGATDLGENRVQEAAAKRPLLHGPRWHLIGPLQRNKARAALELFDVIHTIDRIALVERLQLLLEQHWPGRRLPVLIEVNVADEPQKAGVSPAAVSKLAREIVGSNSLELEGLMAIPPLAGEPEDSRRFFRHLVAVRERTKDELGIELPHLSMGMSHDFEVAVEEGATLIRVGTAIFGPRRT